MADLRRATSSDPWPHFRDNEMAREELTVLTTIAELDYRESGTFAVSLLWHRDLHALSLTIEDSRSRRSLELPVAHDRALHAFRHPFAYAASIGVAFGTYFA